MQPKHKIKEVKKLSTPKIVPNSITPEYLNTFGSKLKNKRKIENQRRILSLCDELEFTIRKIPRFEIKGISSPTHNRYELIKTVSPLKFIEIPEPTHQRTSTGYTRKAKSLKKDLPEMIKKEKKKNKE